MRSTNEDQLSRMRGKVRTLEERIETLVQSVRAKEVAADAFARQLQVAVAEAREEAFASAVAQAGAAVANAAQVERTALAAELEIFARALQQQATVATAAAKASSAERSQSGPKTSPA